MCTKTLSVDREHLCELLQFVVATCVGVKGILDYFLFYDSEKGEGLIPFFFIFFITSFCFVLSWCSRREVKECESSLPSSVGLRLRDGELVVWKTRTV